MNQLKNKFKIFSVKKGSVTIMLSIILVCVLMVVSVIAESARVNIVQAESKTFTEMAGESILAGYARQILNDYGILLVWEDLPIEDKVTSYIQANINMADIKGSGTNFMKTNLLDVCSNNKQYITDNEGEDFAKQIQSFMKYESVMDAVNLLTGHTKEIEENKNKTSEVTGEVDENNQELQEIVSEIGDQIAILKDTKTLEELLSEEKRIWFIMHPDYSSIENKYKKKFFNKHSTLQSLYVSKNKYIEKIIPLLEDYKEKKQKFLEKRKDSSDERDYMEQNLAMLEKVKVKIEENEKLSVSKLSEITSENIGKIEIAVKNDEFIVNELKKLKTNKVTKEDEENKSLYEKAKALIQDGALSLVVEDVSKLSKNAVSDPNLPSILKEKKKNSSLANVKEKAVVTLYAGDMFGSYVSPKKDTALQYEMEYILNGCDNDKENLLKTVEKLLEMRNVINIAYLLTDSKKMSEVSAVATSAATALALPFLEPIIKAILIEAWALAEAVSDVKALLLNKKVGLVKTSATWHTDLKTLSGERQDEKKGVSYLTYCQMLMMLENNGQLIYRMMDLIQANVRKRYNNSFLMSKCLTKVDINATYETQPLFVAMPWCVSVLSGKHEAYKYNVSYKTAY